MSEATLLSKFVKVSADGLAKELAEYAKNGINVILVGEAGFGKTACIKEAFELAGFKYKMLAGATIDPWVDLVGVPMKKVDENGRSVLEIVRPEGFADDTIEAIFVDEFNRSHAKVRNALLELLQFKSINGYKFKNLKCVFAAVNPDDLDTKSGFARYDVQTIDPAQIDRFQVRLYVKSELPLEYFKKQYGATVASIASKWWNGLTVSQRADVSPRRLDYALDFYLKYNGKMPLNRVVQDHAASHALTEQLQKYSSELFLQKAYEENDVKKGAEYVIAEKALEKDSYIFSKMAKNLSFRNFVFRAAATQPEIIVSLLQPANFNDADSVRHTQTLRTMAIEAYRETKDKELRSSLRKIGMSSSSILREMLKADPYIMADRKPAMTPAEAEEFRIRPSTLSKCSKTVIAEITRTGTAAKGCDDLLDEYLSGKGQTKDEALLVLKFILNAQYALCQRSPEQLKWFKTEKAVSALKKIFAELEITDIGGLLWICNSSESLAGLESALFYERENCFDGLWATVEDVVEEKAEKAEGTKKKSTSKKAKSKE